MGDIFQIVRCGEFEIYKSEIDKLDINVINEFGQSLLHEAITSKREEIALDLISRGIDVNRKDSKEQTALHFLGFHPNIKITENILENGGDLSIKDVYGNTPLWYAVFNARGNYDLVKTLLKLKPDVNSKNKAGRSPLDFANQIKDNALISLLK